MNNADFWGEETRQDARAQRVEPQRKRQARKKRGGGAAAMAALLFLVAVLGGGGYFGYTKLKSFMEVADYSGEGSGNATVEIKQGDYTSVIAQTLDKADVVKSAKAFVQAAEDEPKATSIQPGFYKLRLKMSAKSALALLLDPSSKSGVVNVPEGMRAVEVFGMLSKQTGIPVAEFQKVRKNPKALNLPATAKGNLEGYLFPAQYNFPPKATATQILKLMVDRFRQQIAPLDLGARAKSVRLTPGQVITMASLIQAEAGKPSDYRKISRVIYNRNKIKMPLRFDTTVLYVLNKRTLDVRERDTQVVSPYNTYLHQGLPPGPISNPGVKAIEAVLKPAAGPWLYFVATDPTNKVTKFATTNEEFEKLVKEFRAWQQRNPGN